MTATPYAGEDEPTRAEANAHTDETDPAVIARDVNRRRRVAGLPPLPTTPDPWEQS